MLVPVSGGVANLQKRNRVIFDAQAQLQSIPIPNVYIYNVGREAWPNRVGAGKGYNIPACPKGEEYSKPIIVPTLSMVEYDPADGANNMAALPVGALSGELNGQHRIGVVDDIIGISSGSPSLALNTTSLEWFGVFWSMSNPPLAEEVEAARNKRREMNQLRYSKGMEIVEQKMLENPDMSLRMQERKLYNEAALELGYKQLWGDGNLALESCPECKEPVKPGANYCKHCSQAIDPASVSARAAKRAKANKAEEETAA